MSGSTTRSRRVTALALLGGGLAAGVIGATAIGASAQGSTSAATVSSSAGSTAATAKAGNGETAVTGSKATTLAAAALKKVPGGTVQRVTTDTDTTGAAYEVHVSKADGTQVTVSFDANLTFVSMQTDDHRGHGGSGHAGETAVTGAKAATLKAAALAKVPGATIDEVTTDSGDAAYEVHLTKTDGSDVTVKFDTSLAFVSIESGRGR